MIGHEYRSDTHLSDRVKQLEAQLRENNRVLDIAIPQVESLERELAQYKNAPTHPVVMRDRKIQELERELAQHKAVIATQADRLESAEKLISKLDHVLMNYCTTKTEQIEEALAAAKQFREGGV